MSLRVAYVCEGGGQRGWGHVGRGRAVIEEAASGSRLFVGRGFEEVARVWECAGVTIDLAPWHAAGNPLGPARRDFDVIIVDDYEFEPEWLAELTCQQPTCFIDDWVRGTAVATVLVNPNVGATRSDYPDGQASRWLLGAEYAFVRREFRAVAPAHPRPGPAREVLVTFGGSDPGSCTAGVVNLIAELPWYREGGWLTVVLGASYLGEESWRGWAADGGSRLRVLRNPVDFARQCAAADLVVSGASTTTYDLACLGRAFVPVAIVPHQERIAAEWARLGVGSAIRVRQPGWTDLLRGTLETLLADGARRAELGRSASRLVDGLGVARLLDAFLTL